MEFVAGTDLCTRLVVGTRLLCAIAEIFVASARGLREPARP